MNILLTSAGRRTSLLKFFAEAVRMRGGKIFAGDANNLAPTLFLADKAFRLPPVLSEKYIPTLEELAHKYGIKLIVPTIDTELHILSQNRERLALGGVHVLVSDAKLIEYARDKWKTYIWFVKHGFRMPTSWLPNSYLAEDLPEEIFLKPRDGSASANTHAVSRSDIDKILPSVPFPIIQERIRGQEITIDALLDLDGTPIHYVPRIRLKAVGGESVQGVTIDDTIIGPWLVRLLFALKELGGRGPMTLQAFLVEDSEPVFFEVNPRFGGGFPLGYAAGAKYPEWICRMVEGEKIVPCLGSYQRNLYMTRYYEEILTQEPKWKL